MNTGYIKDGVYRKSVLFNKAVLWKDRCLSIPPQILSRIKAQGVTTLRYEDMTKKEIWIFSVEDVEKNMILKKVGQEEQYYFPIDIAKKIKVESS